MRFPLLLLLGAVVAFALGYWLLPDLGGDEVPTPPPTGGSVAPPEPSGDPTTGPRRIDFGSRTEVASDKAIVRVFVCDGLGTALAAAQVKIGKSLVEPTDERGYAEFELRPGRHWLEVTPQEARDGAPQRQRVTAVLGKQVEVRVEIRGSAGGDVFCRVVAAENGRPLEGAVVAVYPYGAGEAVADAEGIAALHVDSDYEFLVVRAEGRSLRRVVPVAEVFGDDGIVEVQLTPCAQLALQVVDDEASPVDGATVRVTAMPWNLVHPATAPARGEPEVFPGDLADGVAVLDDLPAGVPLLVEVVPAAGTAAPASETFELAVGRNERTMRLSALGSIRGRVLDVAGTPVPGARVVAARLFGDEDVELLAEGKAEFAALSEGDGSFVFAELDGGAYAVQLQGTPDWASRSVRVEVAAGAESAALVRAVAATSISGRLVGPGNRPIDAFEVWAMQNGVVVASAITGAGGVFAIRSLAPGEYDLFTELYDQELAMRAPMRVPAGRSDVLVVVAKVAGTLAGSVSGDGRSSDVFLRGRRRGGDETLGGRCDLDGRFEHARIREGTWDLFAVDTDGRVGVLHGVVVEAGKRTEGLEIAMGRGGTIRPVHATADSFAVVRGEDVAWTGSLERGLPGEATVPVGRWTVEFFVRGRTVARREVAVAAGQQVVVDAR